MDFECETCLRRQPLQTSNYDRDNRRKAANKRPIHWLCPVV